MIRAHRLVIFSERIETLKFLEENLRKDLKLKENQVTLLHGGLSDIEQQEIVDAFGKEEAPVRLLLASDVASEGINLHFLCHRMIHFDIPWSLMVFQQRNGRIDRYGQEREPAIIYLITESQNEEIKGDNRILQLLIQKDEQAVKNIGDPSALMGVYDIELEENITAQAIEEGITAEDFEARLQASAVDPLALLMGDEETPTGGEANESSCKMPSLFEDDFSYFRQAVEYIRRKQTLQADFDNLKKTVNLTAPTELENRFKYMPREIWPEDGQFILSSSREAIMAEIKRSRKEEKIWPRIHLLWEQHPAVNWINDKVVAAFGRNQAPVITLNGGLQDGEATFIMSGLIPNRKGHPLVHRWFGVHFENGKSGSIVDFEEVLKKTGINQRQYPNQNTDQNSGKLKQSLPVAVENALQWMKLRRKEFEEQINDKLNVQYRELERLKGKKYLQLEIRFSQNGAPGQISVDRKERERREIDRLFKEYLDWIQETMTTEDNPYVRVVAVLKGAN